MQRNLAKSQYVARCLAPQFAGNVAPGYIPARTPAERIKSWAKRQTAPPMEPVRDGLDRWDETGVRKLARKAVEIFLHYLDSRAQTISDLTDDEVLSRCEEHARLRFTDANERRAYMKGAECAMQEDVRSPLFVSYCKRCVHVKPFDKGEPYNDMKPMRSIMSPDVGTRGFCHALLMMSQERLFGTADNREQHCVKHLNEEERKNLIEATFGALQIIITDYSAMEGSIRSWVMEEIENPIFRALSRDCDRSKIDAVWDVLAHSQYEVSCKEYSYHMPPMRLSGQEHTSSGNFLANIIWMMMLIRMCSGDWPDLVSWKFFAEGDDGIGERVVPLCGGGTYEIESARFSKLAVALGAKLKIEEHQNFQTGSFCGIKLKPGNVQNKPQTVLDVDSDWILSKLLWDVDFDPCTCKYDKMKLYAKCLSYLPRCVGDDELYKAVYYLAIHSAPAYTQMRSTGYYNVWLRVFYKGDMDAVPRIEEGFSLEKYCNRHNLPVIGALDDVPMLLTRHSEIPQGMEIQQVEDANVVGIREFVKAFLFARTRLQYRLEDEYEVIEEGKNNDCAYRAVWGYLHDTDQVHEDYPSFYQHRLIQVPDPQDPNVMLPTAPTLDEFSRLLRPGEHMAFRAVGKPVCTYQCHADGSISCVEGFDDQNDKQSFVHAFEHIAGGHAVYVKKRAPRRVEIHGMTDILTVVGVGFIVFAAVLMVITMRSNYWGVPGYIAVAAISGIRSQYPNFFAQVPLSLILFACTPPTYWLWIGLYILLAVGFVWIFCKAINVDTVVADGAFTTLSKKALSYGARYIASFAGSHPTVWYVSVAVLVTMLLWGICGPFAAIVNACFVAGSLAFFSF
jgi:hypothetical protein